METSHLFPQEMQMVFPSSLFQFSRYTLPLSELWSLPLQYSYSSLTLSKIAYSLIFLGSFLLPLAPVIHAWPYSGIIQSSPSNFTWLQPDLKSQQRHHSFPFLPLAVQEFPYNGATSLAPLRLPSGVLSLDLLFMICLACHLPLLFSCLASSLTLNIETLSSFKTSGSPQTTNCYNPEEHMLHSHHHENLNCDNDPTFFHMYKHNSHIYFWNPICRVSR